MLSGFTIHNGNLTFETEEGLLFNILIRDGELTDEDSYVRPASDVLADHGTVTMSRK